MGAGPLYVDNTYMCKNWKIVSYLCQTNLPANTATRSPGNIFILVCWVINRSRRLRFIVLSILNLCLFRILHKIKLTFFQRIFPKYSHYGINNRKRGESVKFSLFMQQVFKL